MWGEAKHLADLLERLGEQSRVAAAMQENEITRSRTAGAEHLIGKDWNTLSETGAELCTQLAPTIHPVPAGENERSVRVSPVPEAWGFHVVPPSIVATMVPLSPAAQPVRSSMKVMLLRRSPVPEVWGFQVVPPSVVLRMVPSYLEYFKVVSILESLESESGVTTKSEVVRFLENRFNIDAVTAISHKDVSIKPSGDAYVVRAKYEDRKPVFANVDIVMNYDKQVRVSRR